MQPHIDREPPQFRGVLFPRLPVQIEDLGQDSAGALKGFADKLPWKGVSSIAKFVIGCRLEIRRAT